MIIPADQVRPGDIVDYRGERHLVSEVRRFGGASWAVACDATGWGIALGAGPLHVHRCS